MGAVVLRIPWHRTKLRTDSGTGVYPIMPFAAELSPAARAHYRREKPLVFET